MPFEGPTLPAWFYKADVVGAALAVVMFDGLDNAKEMSVLFGGTEISRGVIAKGCDRKLTLIKRGDRALARVSS